MGKRISVLEVVKTKIATADYVQLLQSAPFRRSTWKLADQLDEESCQSYWNDVRPDWIPDADEENIEAVQRLLVVRRPRAALFCAHHKLEVIGPELLFRLMSAISKEGKDLPGDYILDAYHISKAFVIIDKCSAFTLEQKLVLSSHISIFCRSREVLVASMGFRT